MPKNHVFGSFNLNKSEKHRLSFEDIFLGTLDTYTKKMNPPSAVLGGVHGKVSWLIAYYMNHKRFYFFGERHFVCPKVIFFCNICCTLLISTGTILKYVKWYGSRTNFCYLSHDAICILKPVDRKITLPSVITLLHFPLFSFKLTLALVHH